MIQQGLELLLQFKQEQSYSDVLLTTMKDLEMWVLLIRT